MIKKQLFTQIEVPYLTAAAIVINVANYPNFVKWCSKTNIQSFTKSSNLDKYFNKIRVDCDNTNDVIPTKTNNIAQNTISKINTSNAIGDGDKSNASKFWLERYKDFCNILSNKTLLQQYVECFTCIHDKSSIDTSPQESNKANSVDNFSASHHATTNFNEQNIFDEKLTAYLTFSYLFFNYEYLSNISFVANNSQAIITVISTDGPFKTMKNVWKIKNLSTDKCSIDFDIEFCLKNQFLEIPAKLHINQISQTILNCFTQQALLTHRAATN